MDQELHELMDLLSDRQASIVEAPDVLGQIQRQPLAPDPALGGQPPLQVALETFQAVDVAPRRSLYCPIPWATSRWT